MTNVKISVNGLGAGSVELDGRDVSAGIAGLALTTRANEPAELALILSVPTVVVEADASIKLPEPVVYLLVAAGWTRPAADPTDSVIKSVWFAPGTTARPAVVLIETPGQKRYRRLWLDSIGADDWTWHKPDDAVRIA